jgi:hypothetical protein
VDFIDVPVRPHVLKFLQYYLGYYSGAMPVLDGPAPGADAVGRGVVEVRGREGQLLATVPAGNTLVITSGFRVALSIQ